MRLLVVGACVALLASTLVGCADDSGDPTPVAQAPPSAWSKQRFLRAHPITGTPTARTAIYSKKVGALFSHDVQGDHFCTASTVDSPGHNLLVTAAHCIHGGAGGGYFTDLVFVPGYRNGLAPYGVWKVRSMLVDTRWSSNSDPALDVGFVSLEPLHGQNVTDVIGSNKLAVDRGFTNMVRVTGYPNDSDQPVTCLNRTAQQSVHQLRFTCAGYLNGTSGSPWISKDGEVIGVVGGYQQGGYTSEVSYSAYFDDDVESLYQEAMRESTEPPVVTPTPTVTPSVNG